MAAQEFRSSVCKASISEEEWQAAIETAENVIVGRQSQVALEQKAGLALKLTMEMVANLVGNWTQSNDETMPEYPAEPDDTQELAPIMLDENATSSRRVDVLPVEVGDHRPAYFCHNTFSDCDCWRCKALTAGS